MAHRSRTLFLVCATLAVPMAAFAQAGSSSSFPLPTKSGSCAYADRLPDAGCTPGDVFVAATKDEICRPGYAKSVRNVNLETKHVVYAMYGIDHHDPGEYEVDHLVPLELGGSNDVANLWPQPALPVPGFHEKDLLENELHDEMCAGNISLADAQHEIAADWLAAYDRMTGQTTTGAFEQQAQTLWSRIWQFLLPVYQQFLNAWHAIERQLVLIVTQDIERRVSAFFTKPS